MKSACCMPLTATVQSIRQWRGSPVVSGCLHNYIISLKKHLIYCGTAINTQCPLCDKLQNILTAYPEAPSSSPCRVYCLMTHKASVSFFLNFKAHIQLSSGITGQHIQGSFPKTVDILYILCIKLAYLILMKEWSDFPIPTVAIYE